MIVLIGLVLLLAAVVVGVLGVLTNGGGAHAMSGDFSVLGYHVTGSTGTLFFYGIVVGAVGLFGLSVLLTGVLRTARRGRVARRELKDSRQDTASASRDRDDLAEAHRRETVGTLAAPGVVSDRVDRGDRRPAGGRGRLRRFGHRSANRQPVSAAHSDDADR